MPKLATTIGDYERAIMPRSIFAIYGSLLVCKVMSGLMKAIEDATAHSSSLGVSISEAPIPINRVLIVDSIAVLQSIKSSPGMTKIHHLKQAFIKKL